LYKAPIFAIAKQRHAAIAWQYESDKAINHTIIVMTPCLQLSMAPMPAWQLPGGLV
jgi:hypothetical protein